MKSNQLRKQHIKSFSKLSLYDRLSWAFSQNHFLAHFMNDEAKKLNKLIRKNGKKYFGS
jgi:hypothetical protein